MGPNKTLLTRARNGNRKQGVLDEGLKVLW